MLKLPFKGTHLKQADTEEASLLPHLGSFEFHQSARRKMCPSLHFYAFSYELEHFYLCCDGFFDSLFFE